MSNSLISEDFQSYFDDAPVSEEISDIISGSTDWTTDTIVKQIEKENIELSPMFQRRDAWTIERKSLFIESLALGFPIPQIVLAQQYGKFIVLDGKQRLLSLMQFFNRENYTPFNLRGLTILKNLNGKSYDKLENDLEFSTYLDKIENATIRTVVIRNWKNDNILYQIFLRLNTSSVPLSPQELRSALFPGGFVDFINQETSSTEFLKNIFGGEEDFRMRDSELLIRYIAYKHFYKAYTGNLKIFLDTACKKLNKQWESEQESIKDDFQQFNIACEMTQKIFGDDMFCKYSPDKHKYEKKFNRAVFDIMVYYFSAPSIADGAKNKLAEIKKGFENLCLNNQQFLASLSSTTKSLSANNIRFSCWGNFLKEILQKEISIPHFGNEI